MSNDRREINNKTYSSATTPVVEVNSVSLGVGADDSEDKSSRDGFEGEHDAEIDKRGESLNIVVVELMRRNKKLQLLL